MPSDRIKVYWILQFSGAQAESVDHMADVDAHGALGAGAVAQAQKAAQVLITMDDDVLERLRVVRDLHGLVDGGVDDRKHADDEFVMRSGGDHLVKALILIRPVAVRPDETLDMLRLIEDILQLFFRCAEAGEHDALRLEHQADFVHVGEPRVAQRAPVVLVDKG